MQSDQRTYAITALNCKHGMEIKVIPSYHCDMNCSYCYNKHLYRGHRQDYTRLINSLSEILFRTERRAIVEIIGGEPLSSQNYLMTNGIIEHLITLKRNLRVVLQTGSSNIEKLLEVIPKLDGLSYSVDLSSSPKVSNLGKLETVIGCCKDHDVIIQIQTILSPKDTIETICQFIELCSLQGVKWIGLGYPQYQSSTEEELNMQIKVYSELIKYLKDFKEISIGGIVIESVIDFFNGWTYSSSCNCGEDSVTIQPDGSVSPCLYFKPDEFKSIDAFVETKYTRAEQLRNGYCLKCKIWSVCHGGCMAHAKFLTGDVYSHDKEFCYLISGVIKKVSLWKRLKGINNPIRCPQEEV